MSQGACLTDTSGRRIALKSVHIEGQLDGLLASMAITQNYCNDTGKKLEIIYTFPLAWGAVLLGMDVTLEGRRLQALVVEKKEAWERYEKAIDEGDAPVLVERSAPGLYTANLGNIEPGEDVTVELRYAQWLSTGEGIPSLRIPCAVAPRYGRPHQDGGLARHETATADILAQYPLSIKITLLGQTAKTQLVSFSHECTVSKAENSTVITLNAEAMLDRDFSFSLCGLHGKSYALLTPDDNKHVMLAYFSPRLPQKRKPLRLKVLVDCSGSMLGDSIASAKRALYGLLGMLERGDFVSFSCFGDTVRHETSTMWTFSLETQVKIASAIERIQADMGGTEMEDALLSTFKDIATPEGSASSPCVLLITDGAVWNVEKILQTSLASGHRVFAMGVGSSPAESLLQELAVKTGGACMFVSPVATDTWPIDRMVGKICGAHATKLNIDWGSEPEWQSSLPLHLYADDTIHVFASFAEAPTHLPVLRWSLEGEEQQIRAETISRTDNVALTRLGAAQRMAQAATQEEALALSLKYQLVGEHSALFLVHIREGKKSGGLPALHQIPQMIAAGHGGFGSVRHSLEGLGAGPARHASTLDISTVRTCLASDSSSDFLAVLSETKAAEALDKAFEFEAIDVPAYLWRPTPPRPTQGAYAENLLPSPLALLQAFDAMALQKTDAMQVVLATLETVSHSELAQVLDTISKQKKLLIDQVRVLFLFWLDYHLYISFELSRHAQRVLRDQMNHIPGTALEVVMEELDKRYPDIRLEAWGN